MIYPEKLRPGDTVGLVCPCSPIESARLRKCIDTVRSLGFQVKVAGDPTRNLGGYMAGSGRERAAAVNALFADDTVKAVFCLRGGDGGTRAAEYLDLAMIRRHPKIFVGYSDVTTFHLILNQKCELVTFHGPMVSSNMVDDFDALTRASLFECLCGDGDYLFRNPPELPFGVMHPGRATGRVIGGNLSLLSAAVGTPYDFDTAGKLLFIEEVEEPVTKIEKWMYHLRNAGKLRDCAGILLGQFTDITNRFMPEFTALDCIRDILADLPCPVMYDIQSGHGSPMLTLPMGATATMDTEARTLVFERRRG